MNDIKRPYRVTANGVRTGVIHATGQAEACLKARSNPLLNPEDVPAALIDAAPAGWTWDEETGRTIWSAA